MMTPPKSIKKALISVFDKSGLLELCHALRRHGTELYSTGGTQDFLTSQNGFSVTAVEEVTQFPEMMGGRVKTLHPKIFGGILARRDDSGDLEAAQKHGIPLFDLIVVNLYPFWDNLQQDRDTQAKFIDIGGPSMLRAAAKNSKWITVLSSPSDYSEFIQELAVLEGVSQEFRQKVAGRTFQRTSAYDALIGSVWASPSNDELPLSLPLNNATPLRYGENPHQKAAWTASQKTWRCLQGKELSYNNLLDAESAVRIVLEFKQPGISIIKHNNPCGVASGDWDSKTLFLKALESDPKSAFGGVVAVNQSVDEGLALALSEVFLEVVIAPEFEEKAIQILSQKKNLRLIEWPEPQLNSFEVRSSLGGWLVQNTDPKGLPPSFEIVTEKKITDEDIWKDLHFAWLVSKHVRSNAIVVAKGGSTLGIGAGQMSRVDAVEIALAKAKGKTQGAVLASDAFFPFRDNIDLLKDLGFAAVIQPGGSQRDPEVVSACNELGIAMVFTKERHFRH